MKQFPLQTENQDEIRCISRQQAEASELELLQGLTHRMSLTTARPGERTSEGWRPHSPHLFLLQPQTLTYVTWHYMHMPVDTPVPRMKCTLKPQTAMPQAWAHMGGMVHPQ